MLFVFNSWIIIVSVDYLTMLNSKKFIFLANSDKKVIGEAIINRLLSSRNLDIYPLEISIIEKPINIKEVKYVINENCVDSV